MKKIRIVLFWLIMNCELTATEIGGQNSLEYIWNKVVENNIAINEAVLNHHLSAIEFEKYWTEYLPVASVMSTVSYNSVSHQTVVPDGMMFSAGIIERFPGNTVLQVTPVLNITKNILDFETIERYSNIEIVDDFKMNVELSQSLRPYWMQGEKNDPEKKLLLLEKQIAEVVRNIEVKNCIEIATEYYILLRKYERERLALYEMIGYLEKKKECILDSIGRQNLKELDLFSIEEDITTQKKELNTLENEMGKTFINFCEYTGIMEDEFIDNQREKFLFCDLPVIKNLYTENPRLEYVMLMQKKVETEFILAKQLYAPKMSIGTGIPVYSGKSKSGFSSIFTGNNSRLDFSLSFDFSNLLSKENRNSKEKLCKYSEFYEKKQIAEMKNAETKYKFYEKMLQETKIELEKSINVLENKQKTYKAYEEMYENGDCNFLDLQLMRTYFRMMEFNVKNIEDTVWLYEWMMINSKDY